MMNFLRFGKRLGKDQKGATAIEYGLLAALIAVAIIVAARSVGGQLNTTFGKVNTDLATANGTATP
jgi:pilus assembly protein Flp/PilA